MGKNVKILMPELYANKHDNFVDKICYDNRWQTAIITEKIIFGKTKDNYILPMYL